MKLLFLISFVAWASATPYGTKGGHNYVILSRQQNLGNVWIVSGDSSLTASGAGTPPAPVSEPVAQSAAGKTTLRLVAHPYQPNRHFSAFAQSPGASVYQGNQQGNRYNLGYRETHPGANTFRQEYGSGSGVSGAYGLQQEDRGQRVVQYVADGAGFRAQNSTHFAYTKEAASVGHPGRVVVSLRHPPSPGAAAKVKTTSSATPTGGTKSGARPALGYTSAVTHQNYAYTPRYLVGVPTSYGRSRQHFVQNFSPSTYARVAQPYQYQYAAQPYQNVVAQVYYVSHGSVAPEPVPAPAPEPAVIVRHINADPVPERVEQVRDDTQQTISQEHDTELFRREKVMNGVNRLTTDNDQQVLPKKVTPKENEVDVEAKKPEIVKGDEDEEEEDEENTKKVEPKKPQPKEEEEEEDDVEPEEKEEKKEPKKPEPNENEDEDEEEEEKKPEPKMAKDEDEKDDEEPEEKEEPQKEPKKEEPEEREEPEDEDEEEVKVEVKEEKEEEEKEEEEVKVGVKEEKEEEEKEEEEKEEEEEEEDYY